MKLYWYARKRTIFAAAVFVFIWGIASLFLASPSMAQEIVGRYKHAGAGILYRITVPKEKPAAAIVVQYLPPYTVIKSATPAYSTYDPATGIVKWLFSEVEPGELTINLELANAVGSLDIKAEVLFKDHSGVSNTFALEPVPMKRKVLEGC